MSLSRFQSALGQRRTARKKRVLIIVVTIIAIVIGLLVGVGMAHAQTFSAPTRSFASGHVGRSVSISPARALVR